MEMEIHKINNPLATKARGLRSSYHHHNLGQSLLGLHMLEQALAGYKWLEISHWVTLYG
jgi:hypothetical protein